MMKMSEYNKILRVLKELHTQHPTHNFGRHIDMALSDYGSLWGLSDKEVLFALSKYQTQLEMDNLEIADAMYIERVYNDAMDLDHILDENDEYE